MDLLGNWYIEVVATDGNSSTYPILDGLNNAVEDWTTTDIGVSSYREVKFVFVPDPRNFDADGDLKSYDEIDALLSAGK